MFTGIIETTGTVKSVEKMGFSGRITVEIGPEPDYLKDVKEGDSIAVDGVCLTVTGISKKSFTADISGETFSLTTLGGLKPGQGVNLERSLTLTKPLGGHLVTGHIDGTGTIKRKVTEGENVEIEVSVPDELGSQLIRKGSVAVDGISLTVAGLTPNGFRAAIGTHTLKTTTLSAKQEGSRVNIETDIIGKYVERFLSGSGKREITEDFLIEHGFISGDKAE
jgi:riboflavin synthase